jgi:hypothetical protein
VSGKERKLTLVWKSKTKCDSCGGKYCRRGFAEGRAGKRIKFFKAV